MKKPLYAAATIAVGAGMVAVPVQAEASSRGAARPAIVWGSCPAAPAGVQVDPRQRCGTLTVPLDYQHADGRQITIEVSRIPAADPAKRRGVLLLNPGGPGSEGLNMPS